jgi:hypothetical protein
VGLQLHQVDALAGPDADRSAVIRANAALAVVKGATMAALELGGGALDPAEREEILRLALAVLRGPQPTQGSCPSGTADLALCEHQGEPEFAAQPELADSGSNQMKGCGVNSVGSMT